MTQNYLRIRNLFELAQNSDEQTFADAKAALGYEIQLFVNILSSPEVRLQSAESMEHITFKFYEKRNPKRFQLEIYEPKTVEFQTERSATKRSIVLHERTDKLGKYICLLESTDKFLDFAVYIQKLFDAPVYSLDIEGDHAHHLVRLFSMETFRECEHFDYYAGILSNEEMWQALKFGKNSSLRCIAEPGFELEEPISMKSFVTGNAHWFKGPMLMQLDCEDVFVDGLQLQSADINKFLHHWMRSSDRKLQRMELAKECREFESSGEFSNCWDVKKNWEEEKFDLLKITEGLSSFEEPNAEANGDSLCFRRETDKLLITVKVQCHREWRSTYSLSTTIPIPPNDQESISLQVMNSAFIDPTRSSTTDTYIQHG